MQKLSETRTLEFKYDSEEERNEHVKKMESDGWECSGQIKNSTFTMIQSEATWFWYAKFFKSE